MREKEVAPRASLAEFNDILVNIKMLDSRYRKDCINEEEISKNIYELRQTFIEKANEMSKLFNNPFLKNNLVPSLIGKYKQQFEYNPDDIYEYLDQLYADFVCLYHQSCALFLDEWADENDAEAEKTISAQMSKLEGILNNLKQRREERKMKEIMQKEKSERRQKEEEERRAKAKKEKKEKEQKEEQKEEQKDKKDKKGKKGVILRRVPRGGSKIYYIKTPEAKAKIAAAKSGASKQSSKAESQPSLDSNQMSK